MEERNENHGTPGKKVTWIRSGLEVRDSTSLKFGGTTRLTIKKKIALHRYYYIYRRGD